MTQYCTTEIILYDEHVYEGGAWKVAYADFVTAMMAFFLLLWLLNSVTAEEKEELVAYFDPSNPIVSSVNSGAGGVMGGLTMTPEGAMAENKQPIIQINRPTPTPAGVKSNRKAGEKGKTKEEQKQEAIERAKNAMRKAEERKFKEAERKLKKEIAQDPALKGLLKNLKIDMTPEGLRIQILDQDGDPMFPSGSAKMFEKTKLLMGKVADAIKDTPNQLSIRGHTDSVPFGRGGDYTNWNLSSDRALESRNVLIDAGIPEDRVNDVSGRAATDPFLPDDPENAQNRRISIILLKEELTNPEAFSEEADASSDDYMVDEPEPALPVKPIGTFQRTPGAVEFP